MSLKFSNCHFLKKLSHMITSKIHNIGVTRFHHFHFIIVLSHYLFCLTSTLSLRISKINFRIGTFDSCYAFYFFLIFPFLPLNVPSYNNFFHVGVSSTCITDQPPSVRDRGRGHQEN